eukprot:scaffold1332_cov166-Amphora_coffeaeformis.AAC.15
MQRTLMNIAVQHHALERQLLRCTSYIPPINSKRLESVSTRNKKEKKEPITKESSPNDLLRSGASSTTAADGDKNDAPTPKEPSSTRKTIIKKKKKPKSDSSTGPFINCGCPNTCKGVALKEHRNALDFSCQDRIEHLMKTYDISQREACLEATAPSEGVRIQACNPELCNPDACPVFNEKEEIELAQTNIRKILVIATVPKDEKHATALWTQLECVTGGLDAVIVSAPVWSREITEGIATRAREALGWNEETFQTRYYTNDRWDAGLWCDVLHNIDDLSRLESIILVNDSVFVMREFSGIQDTLASNNKLDMVGLSWSHSYSNMLTDDRFWLESVYRGFTGSSISPFIKQTCDKYVIEQCMVSFRRRPKRMKKCIVEKAEVAIAGLYEQDKVVGLYPSDVPGGKVTWVNDAQYWRDVLVNVMNFPVSKVNFPSMIGDVTDERLSSCTRFIDRDYIHNFNYSALEIPVFYRKKKHNTTDTEDAWLEYKV